MWASVTTCFRGKDPRIVFWKMRILEIYWPLWLPATWLYIWMYGISIILVVQGSGAACRLPFVAELLLMQIPTATIVAGMLIPLSAFIICFLLECNFFVGFPCLEAALGDSALWSGCFRKRHRLRVITHR